MGNINPKTSSNGNNEVTGMHSLLLQEMNQGALP